MMEVNFIENVIHVERGREKKRSSRISQRKYRYVMLVKRRVPYNEIKIERKSSLKPKTL